MVDNLHEDYVYHQQYVSNANIELTYRCPLQCPQCFRAYLGLEDGHKKKIEIKEKIKESYDMPLDDFRKICNFFKDNISLCGQFSDPVYHPEFFEILKICTNEYPDCTFKIHTAGHQKNIEWYKKAFELSGSNITWIFGLDGLADTSHMYRKNQNSQLIFDAMMLGSEMKKNIRWQFIVFAFNEHQIETARQICKDKNIKFHLVYTDRKQGNVKLASDKYRAKGNIKEYHE